MTETKSFNIANGGEIYYSNTSGRVPVAFTVHGSFGDSDKGGYDLNGTYIKNFSNSGEYHWVTYGGGRDASTGFQISVQYYDEYMTIRVPNASTISVNCLY